MRDPGHATGPECEEVKQRSRTDGFLRGDATGGASEALAGADMVGALAAMYLSGAMRGKEHCLVVRQKGIHALSGLSL